MYRILACSSIWFLFILLVPSALAQIDAAAEIDKRLNSADSLRQKIEYSAAWNQLTMVGGFQGEMDTQQLAKYFKLLGNCHYGLGDFEKSLINFGKSRITLLDDASEESLINQVNLYTSEGAVYNKLGDYELAEKRLLAGIDLAQTLPEEKKVKVVKIALNSLATTYELLGQYDNAVKTSERVLAIIAQIGEESSVGAGVAHNNLGICYRQLGRNNLAKTHYEKAAAIFTETLGPNSRYTHAALGNAATAIDDYGDVEKAIPILTKKLEVYLEDPGADQIYIVNTHSTLGYIYKRIGDYQKSVDAYERALGKLRSKGSARKDLEIRILKSLATAEYLQKDMAKSRIHLDEAYEIEESYKLLAPADLVRLHLVNATYYQYANQKQQAHKYIKLANIISIKDSINQLDLILETRPLYINVLIDNGDFELARKVIDSTTTFINNNTSRIPKADYIVAQANLDALQTKLACAEGKTALAFKHGLDTSLEGHAKRLVSLTASVPGKKNQRYGCATCFSPGELLASLANLHLEAYKNSPKAKENHLQKVIATLDIKQSYLTNIWNNENFSGLTPTQQAHAKEIRQRIAAYDLMIFENNEGSVASEKKNALYLDSILVLRPQLTSYINKLGADKINFEQTFDYAALSDEQGMFLFHQENDNLHVLFVSQNGVDVHTINEATSLRNKIEDYRTFCRSENVGFGESRTSITLGAELYTELLGWIGPEKLAATTRIAIVEGYPIEGLPFSALLTDPIPAEALGFRDLSFAAEKHAFSYHQSPSAFFASQIKSHYNSKIKLAALAPSQVSSAPIAATTTENVNTIGLTYAAQEVETLIEKYSGTLLKGQEANFYGFLNAFRNSNVVHIASHATSNYMAGEYSYIIITDTASLSGERLYARTISELDLPADLVVLGACESGSGKLIGGEGTISLSNIFLNAGTQSVVHTSWRVEDKLSHNVLLNFYEELDKKHPLDEALVKAQRTYLQTAGGQYLHPFYWSSFAVSGNLTPIESNWSNLLYYALPLAVFVLIFLFWKRR